MSRCTPERPNHVSPTAPARLLDFDPSARVVRGPMVKAELVTAMAKASGGSKVSAEKALSALLDNVFDSLRRGRKVTIGGFGTFLVSPRAGRNGGNPRPAKRTRIPPAPEPPLTPT